MFKKLMASALALTLLVGCGSNGGSAAPTSGGTASSGTTKNVGVAIYQFDDNVMTLYRNELEKYMKEQGEKTGVTYNITIVDGKNDMAEQTNQVENFITQKMDVIILNLVQTSSADAVIDKVVAAGIPLVLINREPLGDNGDGEIAYVMIEGDPENVDAQYRTEYSIKALTDAGYKVKELDDQVGNWAQAKGQEIAANALTQFGNDVEVIFCNNDAMALGAAAAITAAGRTVGKDIYLLGVDALEECVQMVNEGTMTGTVLNDHVGQSHTAVDVAIKALNGEPIENYYWVDYVKVTK